MPGTRPPNVDIRTAIWPVPTILSV